VKDIEKGQEEKERRNVKDKVKNQNEMQA